MMTLQEEKCMTADLSCMTWAQSVKLHSLVKHSFHSMVCLFQLSEYKLQFLPKWYQVLYIKNMVQSKVSVVDGLGWIKGRMHRKMEAWRALRGGRTWNTWSKYQGRPAGAFGKHILEPSGRPWAPELILLQVIMWREYEKEAEDYTPF